MRETIEHPLLGTLGLDEYFYVQEVPFSMFGKPVKLTISIDVYPDDDYAIEENQELAIGFFTQLRDDFGSICEQAIREHCRRIVEEGWPPQPELVVADSDHLWSYAVRFPATFEEPTWGLACVVEWWDKGLGIKFVRDKIVEVGSEHLLT